MAQIAIPAASPSLRPFLVIWCGQAVSLLGSQAVQFALIWWLTRQTGSAAMLSAAAFAGLAPQIALGPLLGALVDRWDRKWVMLSADAAVASAAIVLAVAFWSGHAHPWYVIALLFVRSIGNGLQAPAMLASTTLMVPREHLTRIQGMSHALEGGMLIVAAPLGALLITTLPLAGVLAVDVGTALVAIGALATVEIPRPKREGRADGRRSGLLEEIGEALRYLAARRGHLMLLGVAALLNLWLVPAFALLPLLVDDALRGDAAQFAWMTSLFGVGALVGGGLLSVWGGFRRRIATSISGLFALGLAVLALGYAPAGVPAFALLTMAAIGLSVPFVNGPIQAIFQATVDPALQGRVFTLMGSLAGLTAPIGLALAAPVAESAGVRSWFVAGGLACLSTAAALAAIPAIRRIEERRGEEMSEAPVPEGRGPARAIRTRTRRLSN